MYSTPRVTGFEVAGPHTLVVTFSDSSEQRIDFRPALIGDRFGPLQDIDAFKAVAIDPFGALVWPADTPQRNCLSSHSALNASTGATRVPRRAGT